MKIAICTLGSHGDIQPFLLLGEYLSQQGYEVRLSSAKIYAAIASNYEVEFYPFEGSYEALVNDEEMKKMIGKNPFLIGKKLKENVYPIVENSLHTFYELGQWADIVVYHPKALLDAIGVEFKHKLIKAYVVPVFSATAEFSSPLLHSLPLPQAMNKWTYKLTNSLMNTVKTPIQKFKKAKGLNTPSGLLETPVIYGISPTFLPQPKDYPEGHHFTGFWNESKTTATDLDSAVHTFMTTGQEQKLIITFGSMPYQSAIPIQAFIRAIQQELDIKILLVKAWGLKDVKIDTTEKLMAIDKAPFTALFPLADAVVHHGGAGTTAMALQSGIPQMICPVLHPVGDQYFWGKQVEKQGLGVAPIPLKKLKPKQLVAAVQQLLQTDFSKKLQDTKEKISQENGLMMATLLIEKHHLSNTVD